MRYTEYTYKMIATIALSSQTPENWHALIHKHKGLLKPSKNNYHCTHHKTVPSFNVSNEPQEPSN